MEGREKAAGPECHLECGQQRRRHGEPVTWPPLIVWQERCGEGASPAPKMAAAAEEGEPPRRLCGCFCLPRRGQGGGLPISALESDIL